MKNKSAIIIASIFISVSHNAFAQDISAAVGNPGSTNTMMITNITGVVDTPQNTQSEDFEPLPNYPGVEVAPPPNRISHYNNETTPPDFLPLPPPMEINETITVE